MPHTVVSSASTAAVATEPQMTTGMTMAEVRPNPLMALVDAASSRFDQHQREKVTKKCLPSPSSPSTSPSPSPTTVIGMYASNHLHHRTVTPPTTVKKTKTVAKKKARSKKTTVAKTTKITVAKKASKMMTAKTMKTTTAVATKNRPRMSLPTTIRRQVSTGSLSSTQSQGSSSSSSSSTMSTSPKSSCSDNTCSPQQQLRLPRLSFIDKIRMALEDDSVPLLQWMPEGNSFTIVDTKKFTKTDLPKLFGLQNMSSFLRKLNQLGFKRQHDKVTMNFDIFEHPDLVRGSGSCGDGDGPKEQQSQQEQQVTVASPCSSTCPSLSSSSSSTPLPSLPNLPSPSSQVVVSSSSSFSPSKRREKKGVKALLMKRQQQREIQSSLSSSSSPPPMPMMPPMMMAAVGSSSPPSAVVMPAVAPANITNPPHNMATLIRPRLVEVPPAVGTPTPSQQQHYHQQHQLVMMNQLLWEHQQLSLLRRDMVTMGRRTI